MIWIKRKTTFRILGSIILFAILIGFLYKPIRTLIYRQDPGAVTHAFWRSMQKNDLSTARKIVSTENLALVETWMSNHTVSNARCADFLFEGPDSSGRYNSPKEWQTSIFLTCTARSEKHYCFAIYDIVAEKTSKGWLVTKWGLINEGESIANCRVDRLE